MLNATPAAPATFGELLKFLRKRAHLTQRDLGIAVGYSEAYITRLEGNARLPDPVMVRARFVDALDLHDEPHLSQLLFDLAVQAHTSTHPAQSKTAGESSTNLDTPVTRFIGRQPELYSVISLVQAHRLVTLTGSGGVGKTRLAIEAGLSVLDHFKQGVQIVELAPVADGAQVAQAVAGVFKITHQTGRTYVDALRVLLAGKHLLLILDNCEHVIQACAELVDALLHACPTLHILVTSREALNIPGEQAWRVPSMNTEEAAELFAERAQVVRTDFALNAQNAGEVQTICTQLDGIPLAIELAASRLSGLSVKQLAARLHDRFDLLTNGSRTALKRHQTLHALIAWSHDLLSDQERTLLRRLAVFAGGWSAEAAEAVCATPMDSDMAALFAPNVLPLLLGLVNKSMVLAINEGEETRYNMLETIRQFAREQLEHAGEVESMQLQHARHCLAFLKRTAPARMRQTDNPTNGNSLMMSVMAWLAGMRAERDNLRAALVWSLQQGHDIDTGIQLVLWQQFMWEFHGPREEGYGWLDLALSHTNPRQPAQTRARILACLGLFAFRMVERDHALKLFEEALIIFRNLNDQAGVMFTLSRRANIRLEDDLRHEAGLCEWLNIARGQQDAFYTGMALWYLGITYSHRNEHDRALGYFAESLRVLPEDEVCGQHSAKLYQALALREAGRPEGTLDQIQAALSYFRACGFRLGIVSILRFLGNTALAEGDFIKARDYLREGLQTSYSSSGRQVTALFFESLAAHASTEWEFTRAATLGAVHQSLVGLPFREHTLRLINTAREQLDAETLTRAEAAGRSMSYDQAVAFALSQ
jgi:predicted ATPase